ncbi:MAG: hypothetical protein RIB30_21210 [Thalassospira sp.]|uniref:hypothetical protein n=1 Tax=Thalassospira sp. TaxID=1912094 RepID=UPI0032EE40F1
MYDSAEIELDGLAEDVDPNVVALVDAWLEASAQCAENDVPPRSVLTAERLGKWRDDISIYEFQPVKNDFLVRIDAPSIITLSGESFQGTTPREIDLKYGTNLMGALFRTMNEKRPTFQYVNLINAYGKQRHWLRILLPTRTVDQFNDPVHQVLGARFNYEPVHYI